MAIFTKYANKIIPNAHWEWPFEIEFFQWVIQPHSGRKNDSIAGTIAIVEGGSREGGGGITLYGKTMN